MNDKIIISFTKNDEELLNDIISLFPDNISVLKSKNFDGVDTIFQAVIAISASLVPYLLDIYRKKKEKKESFSIKHNGIEIKIDDEKDLSKTMKRILKKSLKKKKKKKKKSDDN